MCGSRNWFTSCSFRQPVSDGSAEERVSVTRVKNDGIADNVTPVKSSSTRGGTSSLQFPLLSIPASKSFIHASDSGSARISAAGPGLSCDRRGHAADADAAQRTASKRATN